jgi:hypothetical protein
VLGLGRPCQERDDILGHLAQSGGGAWRGETQDKQRG